MKYLFQIRNVASFCLFLDEVYFTTNDTLCKYDNGKIVEISRFEKKMQEVKNAKRLFINDIYGEGFLIIEDKIKRFERPISTVLTESQFLQFRHGNTFVHDFMLDVDLVEIPGRSLLYLVHESILYRIYEKSFVEAYSLIDGRQLWQFDLAVFGTYTSWKKITEQYEAIKMLEVWQEEVIIALSNSLLISLNKNTGELLYKWQELEGFHPEVKDFANKMPPSNNFIVGPEAGILVGASIRSLVEVNLTTREVDVFNITDELNKYSIVSFLNPRNKPENNPLTATHIYLAASMRQPPADKKWSYDCLIRVNRETKKIDWHFPFEESNLGVNTPVMGTDKLYQLDNAGNLYVFEIE